MCEAGGVWEISVLASQFCCEPKAALKKIVFKRLKLVEENTEEYLYDWGADKDLLNRTQEAIVITHMHT